MNNKWVWLVVSLALVMTSTLQYTTIVYADEIKFEQNYLARCGDDVTWSIDEDGVLMIEGTGDMYDYTSKENVPWLSQLSKIQKIQVNKGVTSIGDYVFANLVDITSVIVPSSITEIKEYAFYGCTNIVVQCVTGSVAEQFCDSHGIQMIVHAKQECLDNVSTTIVNQKEATCKEEGYTGDEVCSICNTLIKQGQVINQVNHELEVRNAKDATYLEDGYTGDTYCIYCNELLEEGTVIPKLKEKNKWVCTNGVWYHFNQDGNIDKNLWIQGVSDGKWYYVDETGAMVVSTIYKDTTGKSYCFNKEGQMVTGWQFVDGSWYYFYSDMKTEWQKINNKWYYFETDGVMQTGWKQIGEDWFYFYDTGAMATGWNKINNQWYYLYSDMKTGWQKISNKWYYFETDGVMQTGKIIDSTGKTYYLGTKGNMETGWKQLDGKWYYFKDAMKTDWQKINNKWYYFNHDGSMVTGWKQVDGTWYCFNDNGSMITGWKKLNNEWYYFKSSGSMVTGTYVINKILYTFNKDGVMVASDPVSFSSITGTNIDGNKIIDIAKTKLGLPYVWGGKNPYYGGLDCSGFVTYVYQTHLGTLRYDANHNEVHVGQNKYLGTSTGRIGLTGSNGYYNVAGYKVYIDKYGILNPLWNDCIDWDAYLKNGRKGSLLNTGVYYSSPILTGKAPKEGWDFWERGDLVMFYPNSTGNYSAYDNGGLRHIGIYWGTDENGTPWIIDANGTAKKIKWTPMSSFNGSGLYYRLYKMV